MTARTRAHSPLTRRGAVAAAVVALAGLLAGCSAAAPQAGGPEAPGPDVNFAYDGDVGDVAGAPAPESGDFGSEVTADRSVITTGEMYMTVDDPIATADEVTRIVQAAGGRIDARDELAPSGRDGGSAWLTVRVPSDKLDRVVEDLRGLGKVDEFSTNASDVTTEVQDLDAEISTLRASTQRIEGLLASAKDISDIIALESELDRRQSRLASLEARQRGLDDQVSLSTLRLSLTTEPAVVVDDSPENFWDGLKSGWSALVGVLAALLVSLGQALPTLALVALITAAVVVPLRARRARAARTAVAPTEQGAPKQPRAKATAAK